MATIISVHGTFAHLGGKPSVEPPPGAVPQWWQKGSECEAELSKFIAGSSTPVRQESFVWDGDNSELARRRAGDRLLRRLRELEREGEPYCLIGHSHGGSVISSALMQAAAAKETLPGLQRWITVGTPFVGLRKESALFLRLTLLQKAMFVASLMLVLMFGFYLVTGIFDGTSRYGNETWLQRNGLYFLLLSVPFAFFWIVFKILDARQLYFYRSSNIKRAAETFSSRWLGLWHEDDEALSGLSSIGSIKVNIFHRDFAVPAFSLISVFLLPLLYLFMVTSPQLMVGIAEYLRDDVYQIAQYEKSEAEVIARRAEVRSLRRALRQARTDRDKLENGGNLVEQHDARKKVESLRKKLRDARDTMHTEVPNLVSIERALRFKQRFLEENGKACEGGSLCGNGRRVSLNSRLLLHIVTDEASALFLDDELWRGQVGLLVRLAVPVILVPIVFGLLAVFLVFAVQGLASLLSRLLSKILDELTWFEIKRSALGNDTETEVAVTARPRPPWIETAYPALPVGLGERLTDFSNEAAANSLWKFRNAIGELAFSDGLEDKEATVFSYLTWRELIHSSYFEVPQFRWLLAEAIASTEGFARSAAFEGTPESTAAKAWLAAITVKSNSGQTSANAVR